MNEKLIIDVAKVLEDWNPLGEQANNVEDLSGYRYEAADIISTTKIMQGNNKYKTAIKQVLEQAFNITVGGPELEKASEVIEKILRNTTM